MHALIIGEKSSGKSTLIQKIINELGCPVSGFITKKENRPVEELDGIPVYIYEPGKEHIQSRDNLLGLCNGGHPVVFPGAFDAWAPVLRRTAQNGELIVMDEIGFMEASSPGFRAAVLELLDGEKPVIAAVKQKNAPFPDQVKSHRNCRCFFINEENRDSLYYEILAFVKEQLDKAK